MSAKDEAIIANILKCLDEAGIPLSKIAIQKATYFLKASGVPLSVKFEPYTYGPYSFSLSRQLDDLCFWDKVKVKDKYQYELVDVSEGDLPESLRSSIQALIHKFSDVVGGNYGFNNLELYGTTLYCVKALENAGEEVTDESVLKEFRGWKGNAYPEGDIRNAFRRLRQ